MKQSPMAPSLSQCWLAVDGKEPKANHLHLKTEKQLQNIQKTDYNEGKKEKP
jgi:hypothetical protein